MFEAPAYQPGTFESEEPGTGEVRSQDDPAAVEGKVTHGGEIIEVGVFFQRRL